MKGLRFFWLLSNNKFNTSTKLFEYLPVLEFFKDGSLGFCNIFLKKVS